MFYGGIAFSVCRVMLTFFNLEAIKLIYSFHMPLFALISGYLFFRTSQKRAIDILKSRLISLGVPFFCVEFTALH